MSQDIHEQIEQLHQQGIQLYQRGRYQEAIDLAIHARDLASQYLGEKHLAFVASMNNLAVLYYSMGNYKEAELLYQEALMIQRTLLGNQHPDIATSLHNLAVLYESMGNYAQAEPLYQEALMIQRTLLREQHPDVATTQNNLAELYRTMGDYAQAEPLLRQALATQRRALGEQHPDVAITLNNLAGLCRSMGSYTEAELLYQKALTIQRAVFGEVHPDVATSLNHLAGLYCSMGDYVQAKPLYQEALAIQHATLGERHPDMATSLNNLAMLYSTMGDYAQAESLYRQALLVRRSVFGEVHPDVAASLNNLAALYESMGEYAQAEPLYRQALEIWRNSLGERHPNVATILSNLAGLHESMGDYIQAELLYQQALEIQRVVLGEVHPDVASSLNNLAVLYSTMGDYAQAEHLHRQALEMLGTVLGEAHPNVVTTLSNLAVLRYSTGDYTQAELLCQQALAIQRTVLGEQHPDVANSFNSLAGIHVVTGRPIDGLTLAERVATIDDRVVEQVFSIASERQRMALLISLQGDVHGFLSLVLQYLPHSRAAVRTALNLVLRRKAIGAEVLAAQRDAVLGGRYPNLVPKLQELTVLRTQIAQRTLAGPDLIDIETHQQLLAQWSTRKERLEADLAHQIPEMTLMRKLQTANQQAVTEVLPQGAALVEFVRFDVFNFHAILARGERRWKEAHYVVFVLVAGEPENVQMIDLGEADPIDQLIATFRMAITGEAEANGPRQNEAGQAKPSQGEKRLDGRHLKAGLIQRSPEKYRSEGTTLRRKIFDPLVAVLGNRNRLFLAADGDLNRLPFEVLPTDNGHYLIDTYRISYLSTGRDVLRFRAASSGQATSSLIIADPDFDLSTTNESALPEAPHPQERRSRELERGSLHFERLLGTRNEGEQIAMMLGVQPLLEGDALESQLKVHHSPRILHIATHGFFLPDQQRDLNKDVVTPGVFVTPNSASGGRLDRFLEQHVENPLLRSGLALAGANTWNQGGLLPLEAEDGILTAEDVSALDLLNTELVVLSACETGLGKVHIGEGVFGLRRAFVLAGAETLVMSLWKVPDQQTQELMIDFYQRILAGQPRADALREAQLALKAKYPHPYYWGAFICQGDPRPLALQTFKPEFTAND